MTRKRVATYLGAGFVGLLLLASVVVVEVTQSKGFRNWVRGKIITATQDALGGRVEVGSFAFEWRRLEATMTDFVIHGKEPAGAAPFVRASSVRVRLNLFPSIRRLVNVSFVGVEQPQVNVQVYDDGSTNVPTPHRQTPSDTSALETIVNLAIGRFELNHGFFRYNSSVQPLDVQGNNLEVRFAYNLLRQNYEGRLALQPIYVIGERKTPVVFSLNLPFSLERDKIIVNSATLKSPRSLLNINGSIENLRQPETSGKVSGRISLLDVNDLQALSLKIDPSLSSALLDVDASVVQNTIRVSKLHAALGNSSFDSNGTLNDSSGRGMLNFSSSLDLPELSRLAGSNRQLTGVIALNGRVGLNGNNLRIDPLSIRAFGGETQGSVSLEEFARYQITARLRSIDLQVTQQRLGIQPLPYSASVAGNVEARGNLRQLSQTTTAGATLTISPRATGIPVSGNVNVIYNAATEEIRAGDSTIRLPHSSVTFNGALSSGVRVNVTSQDLHDFLAAIPSQASTPAVRLNGGQVSLQAVLSGSLQNPAINGRLAATRLIVQDRQFDSARTDFRASKSRASANNGAITRGAMEAGFSGSADLENWSPKPDKPLTLTSTISNGDLADVLALAGQTTEGYSGVLTADATLQGTFGNPLGSANIQIQQGTVKGEPFDDLQAHVSFTDQRVFMPSAFITRDSARISLSADYMHRANSFFTGTLTARLNSNSIDLAQMKSMQTKDPNTRGSVQIDTAVIADLQPNSGKTDFLLRNVNGNVSAQKVHYAGQDYGDLTAKAATNGNVVSYDLASNFASSQIEARGHTELAPKYPSEIDARISRLPIERALALAKRYDIPAKGSLSGSAHFAGTLQNPTGNVDLEIANAVFYDEPLDRLRARGSFQPQFVDLSQLEIAAGPSRLDLSARFDHPAANFEEGTIQYQIENGRIDLARLRNLQKHRPGLTGVLQVSSNGKAALQPASAAQRILVQDLNANVRTTALAIQTKNLGALELAASTSAGRLNFTLNSGIANAVIKGTGNAALSGEYPLSAQVDFSNVTWANLRPLMGGSGTASFDAETAGRFTLEGSAIHPDRLDGSLHLSTLQVRDTRPAATGAKPYTLQNQGDIAVRLDKGVLRIDSAHVTGLRTDINASGTASIPSKSLDLKLDANANLELLKTFNSDIFSSGDVVLQTTVKGTLQNPTMNGHLELRSASVSYADLPAGLENANGTIVFNNDTGTIQNLTADSGGGKITLNGFVTSRNGTHFGLRANATGVRVRAQQGVSVVIAAALNLTGTAQNSLAAGTVNIERLTYLPQTDIGSMLTRAAPPVQSPTTPSPLLANMNLDIAVRTSSGTAVQASLAENLQVNANLRIRGKAAQPGVVGSVRLTRGQLVFFGATYRISSGTVSFYNSNRIEPILDISLETQAKGVTVVLSVTGPVDNMKLSYTSDPPLQFEEIVALLAAGKAPTSDPTLLANQPSQPPQSFQQRGESAILGKALADPISNRLQRVFGVSQLKIDPSFTSGSQLPQARVTLQQQVSTNLLFTYVTALDNPNTQVVRIEWSMTPQWSAAANRDENGIFSINLLYKKQFR